MRLRPLALALLALLAAGCSVEALPERGRVVERPATTPDLAPVFQCLRERRLALVSAHRGQPDPSWPENALSSLRAAHAAAPLLLEVDVRQAADGTLLLLHDETLDRTTDATGPVARRGWEDVARARLTRADGRPTREGVPSLSQALAWARGAGAILQLDLKPGLEVADVAEAVRQAGMARRVVLIAYTLDDVRRLLDVAPEMMISASGHNAAEWEALLGLARAQPRLLAFTGTDEPDPALLARLDAAGMPVITGTLGRPGVRLDDRYMADGDGAEYAALAARGVALIASDRPLDAWAALKAAGRDGAVCLQQGGRR